LSILRSKGRQRISHLLKERPAIKSQEKKEQKEKEKMAREGHHEKARRERAGRRA
jgi:hypothetical protein